MRSNGLTAASYRPVADLNPAVAETLLDELKDDGIAAYCQPIETPSMSAFDRPEFHVEVLVRLYVDTAATDRALDRLATKDPYLLQGNDDLAWAQIVAGYDTPSSSGVAPWPVYEDVDPTLDEARTADGVEVPVTTSLEQPGPVRGRDDEVDEERFVPPSPPPLPRLAPPDQLGWLGLIGGPTVLVTAAVFSLSLPSWVVLIAALGFIAGFVTLVVRMDNGEDRMDDPDNGAQV